jgi:hypothetical protein
MRNDGGGDPAPPARGRFNILTNRRTVSFRRRSEALSHIRFMTRTLAVTLALLLAAAPLSPAAAQDRGRRDDQGQRQEQMREQPRRLSEAQAQSIAQSRARGARFVGSRGLRGDSYVFIFERDGQVMEISVSASGN